MSNACALFYLSPLRPGPHRPGHRQRRYLSLCPQPTNNCYPVNTAEPKKSASRLFALFEGVLVGGRRAIAVNRFEGTLGAAAGRRRVRRVVLAAERVLFQAFV